TMSGPSAVSDPQHPARLLRALSSFREETRFCDAHLVLEGEEIPVQKNILAAASPYIRTKLNYNPPKDDGSTYKIELEGISVDIMKEILDYIFSGQVWLNEETIQDVVQAADLLLLTDLKTLCCEFLEGCIAAENCIGIRDFALHYCLHHVHYLASEYLETHFRDVSSTEEFLELTPQKLKEVLSMEKLNVGNERYVFEAVIRWISHDSESRKVHMKDVMSAVWVSGLDAAYLREQMMSEPLVREIVKECNNIPLTPPQQGEAMLASFKPRGYSECIVTVGGEERVSRKPTSVMRCMCPLYDPNRQLWIELAPMSIPRINHGVLSAEGFLFVLGGQDENKGTLSSGEKYDPDTNSWSSLPPMHEAARHNFGVVEIDGILYILGGEDGERELISMESYDIYSRTWTKQPDLTMVRKIGCYAAMKKKIYAMGGGSYGKLFESVECYDPRTQQWTAICPLKERRFGAVACGVASELYVFGGVRSRDDSQASEMVTCKSEFYHDEFKRWIYLNDQNLCIPTSSSFVYGAVPIGASIYVIGDLDTGTNYDYVREFKRSTGTWQRTKPLFPSDLRRTGCAALRIANCKLFRLQLQQGLFRIRVPSP
ncbi:GAN protein, partial [Struthidea cinerea]|nr:GAN protein [Neopipo cinnamomea]NWT50483.1 GAN protein [Erythrocercus mccallii]NXB20882.1 GAN protein [Rhagologus leucostigma]NXB38608.1 GAN protein [Eulacestoma nigropectus]NXB65522.1 GAN protein [Struthidea cinerea]NXC02942.1 GAN protein [Orthonyx spaldingii]NXC25713.1 GAN protein [Campylorhamphus procurvoides]NXH58931.1 GAN protein [Rhabdornis inornatus]NXI11029.1 GAN protein [Irena cyanogastra]NXI88371.1 GAN protein [Rhipidura dahli]NXK33690.1 GAN protein [Piprites chloris]NXM2716